MWVGHFGLQSYLLYVRISEMLLGYRIFCSQILHKDLVIGVVPQSYKCPSVHQAQTYVTCAIATVKMDCKRKT